VRQAAFARAAAASGSSIPPAGSNSAGTSSVAGWNTRVIDPAPLCSAAPRRQAP
jgi:hypothetical protein